MREGGRWLHQTNVLIRMMGGTFDLMKYVRFDEAGIRGGGELSSVSFFLKALFWDLRAI